MKHSYRLLDYNNAEHRGEVINPPTIEHAIETLLDNSSDVEILSDDSSYIELLSDNSLDNFDISNRNDGRLVPNVDYVTIDMHLNNPNFKLRELEKQWSLFVIAWHYVIYQNDNKINEPDPDGEYFIHLIVENKDDTLLTLMLTLHNNINLSVKNSEGRTPLHLAVMYNHLPMVEKLLSKGACVNVQDNYGSAPTHYVINTKVIDVLFSSSQPLPDMCIKNKKGYTPISLAEKWENSDVVQAFRSKLITSSSYVDLYSSYTFPHSQSSCTSPHAQYATLPALMSNIIEDELRVSAWTELAKEYGTYAITNFFIRRAQQGKSVDINKCDEDGNCWLHTLSQSIDDDLIFHLTQNQLPINTQIPNREGHTPLHLAAIFQKNDSVSTLLNIGAQKEAIDGYGKTALDYAIMASNNNQQIIELLSSSPREEQLNWDIRLPSFTLTPEDRGLNARIPVFITNPESELDVRLPFFTSDEEMRELVAMMEPSGIVDTTFPINDLEML